MVCRRIWNDRGRGSGRKVGWYFRNVPQGQSMSEKYRWTLRHLWKRSRRWKCDSRPWRWREAWLQTWLASSVLCDSGDWQKFREYKGGGNRCEWCVGVLKKGSFPDAIIFRMSSYFSNICHGSCFKAFLPSEDCSEEFQRLMQGLTWAHHLSRTRSRQNVYHALSSTWNLARGRWLVFPSKNEPNRLIDKGFCAAIVKAGTDLPFQHQPHRKIELSPKIGTIA